MKNGIFTFFNCVFKTGYCALRFFHSPTVSGIPHPVSGTTVYYVCHVYITYSSAVSPSSSGCSSSNAYALPVIAHSEKEIESVRKETKSASHTVYPSVQHTNETVYTGSKSPYPVRLKLRMKVRYRRENMISNFL